MRDLLYKYLMDFGLPVELIFLIWAGSLFFIISIVGQAAVVFMVLMERKILAWITQRKGPNRVGPWGLLQTVADGVKLLFKEDIMTPHQDKFLFTLGPVLFFLPVFVIYALIPFTDKLLGLDLVLGLLFIFALSSLSVVGIVLSGWASNNKYSLIGGMRSASQAISYEIPLVLSALSVALAAGTLNIKEIVEAQNAGGFGALSWFAISILPISFFIFWISSIAEVNRIPFDLPEAESELVSGYNTEYSGMKFALFFLAEYASLFAMSALTVVLFFGGYYSPLGGLLLERVGITEPMLLQMEMVTWFILKTYVFIALAMLIRGTLPRLKPDQLMGFSWKFLIPLSLINIFIIAILKMSWLAPVPITQEVFGITLNLTYLGVYLLLAGAVFLTLVTFGNIFKRKTVNQAKLQQRTV
jgi:NADH-quinone oxidoreductase subunit H